MKIKVLQLFYTRNHSCLKAGIVFLFIIMFMTISSISFAGATQSKNTNQKDSPIDLSSFKLQQNYPNPFNPVTEIKFSIPVESYVELKVYNVLGNEVAILIKEEKPAGEYSVKFNASSLSSGIYIYRLHTDYSTITKKMTLIK